MIIDFVRESCQAYPLDHFLFNADVHPEWPTDEALLERENLAQFVGTSSGLTFFTAYVDPNTRQPALACENSFDIDPDVHSKWAVLLSGATGGRLVQVMTRFTLVLSHQASHEMAGEILIFQARDRHTWALQPRDTIRQLASDIGVKAMA